MTTTISQAARDAAEEMITERESSMSVASDVHTDNMMALLQQIASHQIQEMRARENYQDKREERKRERPKRKKKNDLKMRRKQSESISVQTQPLAMWK